MAEPNNDNGQAQGSDSWFTDIVHDGSNITDQLQSVKDFAYRSFDRIDGDHNGFISLQELEDILATQELKPKERLFISFLIENHDQIADAFDEQTIADGISRKDLEAYFDLIATLL